MGESVGPVNSSRKPSATMVFKVIPVRGDSFGRQPLGQCQTGFPRAVDVEIFVAGEAWSREVTLRC